MGNKKILVADNDISIRDVLSSVLTHYNFDVRTVENGEEALRLMEMETFDLIITDISMPKIDGLTLVKIIKSKNPGFPTIVMSGFSQFYNERDLANAEVDVFIEKPIKQKELLEQINLLLKN